MEQQEFDQLIATPEELIKKIQAAKTSKDIPTYQKQYDPKQHDVFDSGKRPDKIIEEDQGTSTAAVNRLPIPVQKKIVGLAAAFLCGNPIELSATPADDAEKNLLAVLVRSWKDNKLDYESKKLAKLMKAETEVAELWYLEAVEPGYWKGTVNDTPSVKLRMRLKIIANKYGDTLFPVFNNAGDMIAFGRAYTLKVGDKAEEHFDVYTEKSFYLMTKLDAGWDKKDETNPVGKIPVIYYSQDAPEWNDVQEMIDRYETLLSNHADTNDYSGSPITLVSGDVEGFAKKGERGKVLLLKNGADAKYLESNNAPTSLELEFKNLRSLIHDMTDTPDISIENMKSLGVFSGIALKMLFLGAHLKASDSEETFGKGIQRRINFMKAALCRAVNVKMIKQETMTIEPKFEYYLPKNNEELVNLLSTATVGKPTMSQTTAVGINPFVKDTTAELTLIEKEGGNAEINEG